MKKNNFLHLFLVFVFLTTLIWSGMNPKDQFTWFLETVPGMIGFVLCIIFYNSFRLSNLLYILITLHAVILCIGGKYTYAEVPVGFWVQETFGFTRNHYDRLGHFAQGFVPAILAREIFIRKNVILGKSWLFVIVVCICLSFSAFYEFIEWWVALASGENATAFLGTQGDIWDTQWDMFLAFVGAIAAQVFLSKHHDRQISKYYWKLNGHH